MKKTLAALIVAATAASANAATVYQKDGTSIDVEGSFRLFLGKESKDQRTDLINNGSRLWVKVNQELGNGLSALGGLEMRFDKDATENNSFANPNARQLFAGFSHKDVGTLTFGRQDTTLDLVQLSDFTYPFGGNNNLRDHADKSVKFLSAEWHGLSLGLDYLFGNSNKASTSTDLKYGYGASLFYTRDLAKDVTLNLAAGYIAQKNNDDLATTTAVGDKNDAWRTSAQLVFGKAALGVEFGRSYDKDPDGTINARERKWLVGAQYQVIEPSKVYFQYQNNQTKDFVAEEKTTENKYIVGVDYKLHKNVVVFTEVSRSVTKTNSTTDVTKENDTAYGVGMRVFF